MANGIYDTARKELLSATLNWPTRDMVLIAWKGTALFVPTEPTVADFKAHGAVTEVARSLAITAKSVTNDGKAKSNNVVIPGITMGNTINHFTLVMTAGTPDSAINLLYIDDALNLPFEGNGLDVVIQPDWAMDQGWFRP